MSRSLFTLLCIPFLAQAHDIYPRTEPTYTIDAPAEPDPTRTALRLHTREGTIPVPARFTILVDGRPWSPRSLNKHGLRFTSIHTAKKQTQTILYSRGTGPVECNLPGGAKAAALVVTRGYDTIPARFGFSLETGKRVHDITAELRRWSDLRADGWLAADEHLHYERSDSAHDSDWFTMLAADGLDQGFFMILDGGNLPGPWSQQFAYGKEGRIARDGLSLIPGEEFRCSLQGHNNLHGISQVLHPITVGRGKSPPESHHWPATHDVLKKVTATGGIGGPAHGGTFGKASTAVRDAILGASEFFELANTHLYELQSWYRLLNCGYILPPVAGTDLPNFPYRENWQPFLGETRTYVRVDDPAASDFETWKKALRAGRSFVTSGPLLSFTVDGQGPGDTLRLPSAGKKIEIVAELASPLALTEFEIVRNGEPIPVEINMTRDEHGVHRWTIREETTLEQSSWFAARGAGIRKNTLWARSGILQQTRAHTAAIPVFVGDAPIRSNAGAEELARGLEAARSTYENDGRFPDDEARDRTLLLFDNALDLLRTPPGA